MKKQLAFDSLRRVAARAQAVDNDIGRTLPGGYVLLEEIGRGGVGVVYKARATDDSLVAVKRLHPHLVSQRGVVERFRREAALLARVPDTGIVPIVEVGEDDGIPFLVSPLLQGETLEERRIACGGKLTQSEVVAFGIDLLRILTSAHSVGVIHRDIKPANVFRERSGVIRLLDFGLGGLVGDDDDDDTNMSGVEELVGTVTFMAPEQAAGRLADVDTRSDIYAVGALLFKLASGLDVHEGSSSRERLMNAATRPAPRCELRDHELNPALAAICDRALAFSPAQRFQQTEDMRQALRGLSLTQLRSESAVGPQVSVARPRWPLAVGAAALVAAGLVGWKLSARTSTLATSPIEPALTSSQVVAPTPSIVASSIPSGAAIQEPMPQSAALSRQSTPEERPKTSKPKASAASGVTIVTSGATHAATMSTVTAPGPVATQPGGDPWDRRR